MLSLPWFITSLSLGCIRCAFIGPSFSLAVPSPLCLLKLEEFGHPKHLFAWLPDYLSKRIQCTRLPWKTSTLLVSNPGVSQGANLSPYLFSVCVSNLSISPLANHCWCRLTSVCIWDRGLQQLISHSHFSVSFGWNLNLSKCIEFLFSYGPVCSLYPSFTNSKPLTSVGSNKCLEITCMNLKWSSHVSNCDNTIFSREKTALSS